MALASPMVVVMGGGAIEAVKEKELSRFPRQIGIVANSISANQSAARPSRSQPSRIVCECVGILHVH